MGLKTLPHGGGDDHEADSGIVAEINIVPLTDIFLVLLIIFMVTSSVMSQMGVQVNLPTASAESTEAQPEGVIVTLLPDGGVQINDQAVSAGELERMVPLLESLFEKTKGRLVILEGDRKAFLGSAISVMDQARKAGAERFAIATKPE